MLLNKSKWNEMNFTLSNVILLTLIVRMEMMMPLWLVKTNFLKNERRGCNDVHVQHALLLSLPFLSLFVLCVCRSSFSFAFDLFCFVSPRYHFRVHSHVQVCVGAIFFIANNQQPNGRYQHKKLCFSFRNRLVNHGNWILCIRLLCLSHQQTFS